MADGSRSIEIRSLVEYVNLGCTGVKVSRVCLGCMTYGSRKWREWVLEEPYVPHPIVGHE